MINIQRRIRVIDGRIENAISAQEFEKAARYRLEEDLEQENLQIIKERWRVEDLGPAEGDARRHRGSDRQVDRHSDVVTP